MAKRNSNLYLTQSRILIHPIYSIPYHLFALTLILQWQAGQWRKLCKDLSRPFAALSSVSVFFTFAAPGTAAGSSGLFGERCSVWAEGHRG